MNWSVVIPLLLKLVVWLVKNKLDDNQQHELGRSEAVQEALDTLSANRKKADEIDQIGDTLVANDVDRILHEQYRDIPTTLTTEYQDPTAGGSK